MSYPGDLLVTISDSASVDAGGHRAQRWVASGRACGRLDSAQARGAEKLAGQCSRPATVQVLVEPGVLEVERRARPLLVEADRALGG